ncbi:HEPN-associated N-terminal domain-containing protein [Gordonia soli]|uniref:RES domain-containing protein n=1 Tax=Gordonia soli NBRC 108243 TaxID=1223545 RepID=M0QFX1_9ACTN|nr:HEPN-associated N-terminal domain-containing protein [Gordonia soli]GAC67463.1 hypothetical protein GS4_08_00470 [Gordonia soli NBRC 108243]
MGISDHAMEAAERGWVDGDEWICGRCLTNPSLRRAIFEQGEQEAGTCTFCNAAMSVALLDVVVSEVAGGLSAEYDDPISEAGYDGAEGGYQTTTYNTGDLLQMHDDISADSNVVEAIANRFGSRVWCQRNPYALTPEQALVDGWDSFCDSVKKSRRYTLLVPDPNETLHAGELARHTIPGLVAGAIADANLTKVILEGARWWRVRVDADGGWHSMASAIGTPEPQYSKDNRMTPKGIGAFYGATTLDGALAEVGYPRTAGNLSAGEFEVLVPLTVIDLSTAPPIPSLFDRDRRHLRGPITFLHEFSEAIRVESPPSDVHLLGYIPTQVITEMLRYYAIPGKQIDGILWRSAKNPNEVVCALFVDHNAMIDSTAPGRPPAAARMMLDVGTVEHRSSGSSNPSV